MNSAVANEAWRTSTTWRRFKPSSSPGSMARKAPKSPASNFTGRELPQDRPQTVTQLRDARLEEEAQRFAGLGQHPLLHHVARALDREHEAVGHLLSPLGEGRRCLRAVKGAVDLDAGEFRAGVGELLGVR